jgi:myo-inositol 2-dehydrogenase / D-chiro-inositol 1-dehydrogenase
MIGLAICGVGKIGEVHAGNLASLRGCRLTGLFDADAHRLARVCERFGSRAYGDLKELLGDPLVDAAVVSTPSDSHAEVACRVMRAGKHVFIEKPLAATLDDCRRILEVARETGCVAQAGFCERFNVHHLELKRAVEAGKLGEVRAVHASRLAPYAMSDPNWPLGVLDTSVHNLDLILWLFGAEPAWVLARGTKVYPESDMRHSATVLMGYSNGAMAAEHIAWIQDEGHPLSQCARSRMMVQGSRGSFFVELNDRPAGLLCGGKFQKIDTVILGGPEYSGCLKLQFEYFLRSIEEGAPVLAPLEDALRTERVAIAAKTSLESGEEVRL